MTLNLDDPQPWTWAKLARLGDEDRAALVSAYGARGKLALLIAARAHPLKPVRNPFLHKQFALPCRGWECRGCPMEIGVLSIGIVRCMDTRGPDHAREAYARLVAAEGLLPTGAA
ncbi:MAG: hypothetical protein WC683_02020 [bacterium]